MTLEQYSHQVNSCNLYQLYLEAFYQNESNADYESLETLFQNPFFTKNPKLAIPSLKSPSLSLDVIPKNHLRFGFGTVALNYFTYKSDPEHCHQLYHEFESCFFGAVKLFRVFSSTLPLESCHDYSNDFVYASYFPSPQTPAKHVIEAWLSPYSKHISNVITLKGTGTQQHGYFIILKFISKKIASAFHALHCFDSKFCQGKPFYSIKIQAIQFQALSTLALQISENRLFVSCNSLAQKHIQNKEQQSLLKVPCLIFAKRTELPTCFLCLAKLDFCISGIPTLPPSKLPKNGSPGCFVCQFSSLEPLSGSSWGSSSELTRSCPSPPSPHCSKCFSHSNLWICLLCSNLGCGRYEKAHAYEHFLLTAHSFVLELVSRRIWDYDSDTYIHQLAPTEPSTDTTTHSSSSASSEPCLFKSNTHEKQPLQKNSNDYYLYNSDFCDESFYSSVVLFSIQMESQKEYYQNLLSQTDLDHKLSVEILQKQNQQNIQDLKNELAGSNQTLCKELHDAQAKAKKNQEALAAQLQKNISLCKSLQEEKTISSALNKTVLDLQSKLSNQATQITELESQINDLCLHFEARNLLSDNNNNNSLEASSLSIKTLHPTKYKSLKIKKSS